MRMETSIFSSSLGAITGGLPGTAMALPAARPPAEAQGETQP